MSYATDWAGALADVTAAGSAVTFAWTTTTYDETTGVDAAPVAHTVLGSAIRTKGNPQTYLALDLIQSEAPTLLFTPSTRGSLPPLQSSVTWGGLAFTVRDVDPLDPDGRGAILAKIVVAR